MHQNVTVPEVKAFRLMVNSFLSGDLSGLFIFHRRAQSNGQKTELSLLKIFAERVHLHFLKYFFFSSRLAFEVTSVKDRWPRSARTAIHYYPSK